MLGVGGDRFVVGRDTRRSGPLLEAALAAGLASAEGGGSTCSVVAPTPAIAQRLGMGRRVQHGDLVGLATTRSPTTASSSSCRAGASSPTTSRNASKPSSIGSSITAPGPGRAFRPPTGSVRSPTPMACSTATSARLSPRPPATASTGFGVVIDCANGAASEAAPSALRRLGADVTVINDRPDRHQHQRPLRFDRPVRGLAAGWWFEQRADAGLASRRRRRPGHRGRWRRGDLVDGDQIIGGVCPGP